MENGILRWKFDAYDAFRPGVEKASAPFGEDETHYFIQDWFDANGELPELCDIMGHFETPEEHQQEVEHILYQYQMEGITHG